MSIHVLQRNNEHVIHRTYYVIINYTSKGKNVNPKVVEE